MDGKEERINGVSLGRSQSFSPADDPSKAAKQRGTIDQREIVRTTACSSMSEREGKKHGEVGQSKRARADLFVPFRSALLMSYSLFSDS